MIFENRSNLIPLIGLRIIIIMIILGFGILLGNREAQNPRGTEQSANSTGTFDSLGYQGTQVALLATSQAVQS